MNPRIKRATRFIEMYYSRKISLRELAECANLSESHLQYLFKLETKVSPAKYLKRIRMVKASELLRSGEPLTINDVRTRVGFKEKSHFARSFKEWFGLAPSEYRARFAKGR